MPYIDKGLRPPIDKLVHELGDYLAQVGDINYTITRLIDEWLQDVGVCYTNINAAIGVLECAKQELYRRVASPYEDVKISENGDAYESPRYPRQQATLKDWLDQRGCVRCGKRGDHNCV